MIIIGQLVCYVGVTIKAVRHYDRSRLLAQQSRDAAGSRRYTAQNAIDLVRDQHAGRSSTEAGPISRR